jgi:phosphatidylinositol glycan class S
MRTRENSDEARKTLAGIVRLVSKIKEMKVGEGVRNKVLGAVERLEMVSSTERSKWWFR